MELHEQHWRDPHESSLVGSTGETEETMGEIDDLLFTNIFCSFLNAYKKNIMVIQTLTKIYCSFNTLMIVLWCGLWQMPLIRLMTEYFGVPVDDIKHPNIDN